MLIDVVQLVKRKTDLENEMDCKLKALRDDHEQERQRLASEFDVRKQKLNDDHERCVSEVCDSCLNSLVPQHYYKLCLDAQTLLQTVP